MTTRFQISGTQTTLIVSTVAMTNWLDDCVFKLRSVCLTVYSFFDVMSTSSPQKKIALLKIALRFESISGTFWQHF